MRKVPRIPGLILLAMVTVLAGQTSHAQSDDKLTKKIEKLDAQLIKVCGDLAKKYDEEKSPEAAHFFASCALGFGAKDDKLTGIKNTWEVSVFIGKVRGGQVLKDTEPIISALSGLNQEYRAIRDSLWIPGTRGTLSNAAVKALRDAGVRMELTQEAHEYIRATQRFNALRQAMGLRAIFWDFDNSMRLILVAWYMGQTGDYNDNLVGSRESVNKNHVLYTPAVEDAKRQTGLINGVDITQYPEHIRPMPLHRASLLNPNARTLWLARWVKGYALGTTVLHAIPQLPYRDDIPTPSGRFKDETVVKPWSDWVDTEDTVQIKGMKVPFVRYPYDGEPDAPLLCYGGEDGWARSEYKFLDKAGVPIMLRIFEKATPTMIETTLLEPDGKTIPCRLYLNGDIRVPAMADWATLLLIPERQLVAGQKHTITMKCTINDVPFESSWTFTTRKQ